jgi:hypothetical protein
MWPVATPSQVLTFLGWQITLVVKETITDKLSSGEQINTHIM